MNFNFDDSSISSINLLVAPFQISWWRFKIQLLLSFQINIDPESLKPKLPSRKDLKPYPVTCYLEYRGHKGAVMSISTEASGQWIVSGVDAILIFLLYI